jgi:HK97 family phage portal protein
MDLRSFSPDNISSPTGGFMFYDSNTPNVLGPSVVNAYTTLSIPSYWRAMNFIACNLASFPRRIVKDGEEIPNHRLTKIISRKPNPYQSGNLFWRTLFFHRSHYSNGFAEIIRDTQFNPVALVTVRPEQCLPFRWLPEGEELPLTFYFVGGANSHVVPASDFIHFSGLSYDGMSGFNPVWLLQETLERGRLVDRYITRFLTKGSVVRGAVEFPGGVTKDQVEAAVTILRQFMTGADAERDIMVLSQGAKLSNNSIPNQQSQLIELTQHITKQIAQIVGVPPVFLYELAEGKYNAMVEEAFQQVVRDTFRPLIEADEEELTNKLLSEAEIEAGYSVDINVAAVLRGNTKTESDINIAQVGARIKTPNEARRALGMARSTDPAANQLIAAGQPATKAPAPGAEDTQ